MKIFVPQAETITQLMVNTVGSESVMKERQEKRNGIKKHEKIANKPFRVFSK